MSVMPLPHFRTLYLHPDAYRVKLEPTEDGPTIGEFGRLHFSRTELKQIRESERKRKMAFELINVGELPAREFGRKATEPRISISEGGQFSFNALVQQNEAFAGKAKLLVRWDSANRMIGFMALGADQKIKNVPDNAYLPLKWGKDKTSGEANGLVSASGSKILTKIGFEFKPGNTSLPAKFDEKAKMFVIVLPESMKAEAKPEKPKTEKKEASKANGAPAPASEPAKEEEILEIS